MRISYYINLKLFLPDTIYKIFYFYLHKIYLIFLPLLYLNLNKLQNLIN